MDHVYLSLDDWWARDLRKLGAEFAFRYAGFREAAERYSVDEIAELYRRIRAVAPVPESHWRDEFARVFWRAAGSLPAPDWDAYQQDFGPGVFGTIDDGDVESLRRQDAGFRKLGFRVVDVRLTTVFLVEALPELAAGWFPVGVTVPDIWSPLAFAEWRERAQVVAVLRELSAEHAEPVAAPDPAA